MDYQDNLATAEKLAQAGLKGLYPALFARIDSLALADDVEFAARFPELVGDLERDFAREEEWMERSGFIGLRSHREHHAELLRLLHHAQSRVLDGDCKLGRKIASLLSPWFSLHIATMDISWAAAVHVQQQAKQSAGA
jgi:hemerythrin-like metal-binding protein